MTELSENEFKAGKRIPEGYRTEFNFFLHQNKHTSQITESSQGTAFGQGTYQTVCDEKEKNECELKMLIHIGFPKTVPMPKYFFVDIADKHTSERLQCDGEVPNHCFQFAWTEPDKNWITDENMVEHEIKTDDPDYERPFSYAVGTIQKNGVFTMSFNRTFDPDVGKEFIKGQTKEIVVGAMGTDLNFDGSKMRYHSHKMEMRLGNEIWFASKEHHSRKLTDLPDLYL